MKTKRHFLYTMLLMTLLCVQPIQLFGQNNFNKISDDIKALKDEITKLKENCTKLENTVNDLEIQLDILKSSLSNNNNSKQPQQIKNNEEDDDNLTQLLNYVDGLLNLPYSDIDVNTIDGYLERLKTKMPTKKGVKNNITKAYEQLTSLKKQLDTYNKACDAVTNKPYNAKLVNQLLPQVRKLPKDKAYIKGCELDLESQLECYKEYTDLFNDTMRDAKDYQAKNNKNKLKAHIDNKLKKNIEFINQIPYLKKQWEDYYKSIK